MIVKKAYEKVGFMVFLVSLIFIYFFFFFIIENAPNSLNHITGKATDAALNLGTENDSMGPNACRELWNCTKWEPVPCPENTTQTRICYDLNNCGTIKVQPETSRICEYIPPDSGVSSKNTEQETSYDAQEIQLSPIDRIKPVIFAVGLTILTGMLGYVTFEKIRSQKRLHAEKKSPALADASMLRLVDYIRRELKHGLAEEKIRNKLLYEGWNEYIVEKAFVHLHSLTDGHYLHNPHGGIESLLKHDVKSDIKNKLKAFE